MAIEGEVSSVGVFQATREAKGRQDESHFHPHAEDPQRARQPNAGRAAAAARGARAGPDWTESQPQFRLGVFPRHGDLPTGVLRGRRGGNRHFQRGPPPDAQPDVNLSRHRRETPSWERYNPEEGKTYSRNRHHLANLKPNPVNAFPEAETLKEGTDEPFSKHL